MKKYLEILKKCHIFNEINEDNLIPLLTCLNARVIKYTKNETIFAEGEPAQYIGIVLSGTVLISRTDFYGNRTISASISESGIFGEAFACADIKKMPVCVVCADNCEIMFISCKKIINPCSNVCAFHNKLIFNLLKIMAEKNILLNQKAEIISKRTTREKLMAYLLYEAKKNNSTDFEIPYDRQALADFLHVDRSGLSAEISKLRKEGLIESKKNKFRFLY